MRAGAARIDITPDHDVWMDGMIREHRSSGVHDPIFAKALVLANGTDLAEAYAIVSMDICVLSTEDCQAIRNLASRQTGIPAEQIILAAVHNHSGPATVGLNNPRANVYMKKFPTLIASVIAKAAAAMIPAAAGWSSGREDTISHYRRLLADDGHVVMNWEPWPAGRILRPLGEIDPEVGVMKIVAANDQAKTIAILFNHAGHPNVMSGDNYLITADYPGRTEALLEQAFGGIALFLNGAQGTMDIDGLKDRDWSGIERVAHALAEAVTGAQDAIHPLPDLHLHSVTCRYRLDARKITTQEKAWAEAIFKQTGGVVKPVADGVGDDYKANLYLRLSKVQNQKIDVEQTCLSIGDCIFLTFPGELFTEIGLQIKAASPFQHTYILGLANGYIGYVPTREAISQGGYEPAKRRVDDAAAEQITTHSLALLQRQAECRHDHDSAK